MYYNLINKLFKPPIKKTTILRRKNKIKTCYTQNFIEVNPFFDSGKYIMTFILLKSVTFGQENYLKLLNTKWLRIANFIFKEWWTNVIFIQWFQEFDQIWILEHFSSVCLVDQVLFFQLCIPQEFAPSWFFYVGLGVWYEA